ncbi:MAG: phosphate ABC transporter substrate-binding protein [Nitrospiraceae bacterium]|nr:MAG: phosphate ABC transporter substrate-binding protein [Nitrospiraceae bacterium]
MKKVLRILLFSLTSIMLLTALSIDAQADEVRLHGSTTVQKRIMEPGKDALEQATGINLALIGNGTGNGLEDLVKGKCHASMASEELADAVASMKAATGLDAPPDIQGNTITSDVIKVIVHPSNPVTRLSKEQLKGLHTGKITNWKEVGGADMPVIVVTSHLGSATKKVFQKTIMDGEPYAATAIVVETTRKEVDMVNFFPEGIGAVSQGFITLPGNKEKVKVVETREISRPLMLITKGAPSPDVMKVLDFFKGEGKGYIKE